MQRSLVLGSASSRARQPSSEFSLERTRNLESRPRYEVAIEAARAAGQLALNYFNGSFEIEIKPDQTPVTVADKNAESLIREMVSKYFPGDGFLGEEFGDEPSTTGYRWIIDPIDGTKNFVRRVPFWGTLIGLEYKGEMIAGAVAMPTLGEMFHALRGNGAYRDNERIHVSNISELNQAHVCFSSLKWFEQAGRSDSFLKLISTTSRERGFGDVYGFLLVAQGSFEMMIDHGVHPWDVAALLPIVLEAGGQMTNWQGETTIHSPDVLASNGLVHQKTLEFLS